MLARIRRRTARLFMVTAVILMLVGTPTVAPAYADCATTTSTCSN